MLFECVAKWESDDHKVTMSHTIQFEAEDEIAAHIVARSVLENEYGGHVIDTMMYPIEVRFGLEGDDAN